MESSTPPERYCVGDVGGERRGFQTRELAAGNRRDIEAFLAELDPDVGVAHGAPDGRGRMRCTGDTRGFGEWLGESLGRPRLKPSSSSPRFGTLATGSSR